MKKLSFILLLALASCSAAQDGKELPGAEFIYRDYPIALSLSETAPDAALEAARAWNTATGVEIFAIEDEGNIQVEIDDEVDYSHGEARVIDDEGCVIFMTARGWTNVKLWEHELGHCMGLGHSEDLYEIMAPSVSPTTNISPREAALVADFWEAL